MKPVNILFSSIIVISIFFVIANCATATTTQPSSNNQETIIQEELEKQDITEINGHYEAAKELSIFHKQIDLEKLINQILELQLKSNTMIRPYRHILFDFYKGILTSDEMYEGMIYLYMELFTEQELRELYSIMKTNVMKKYNQLSPEIMKRQQEIFYELMQKNYQEFNNRLEKEIKRIQELQGSDEQPEQRQ